MAEGFLKTYSEIEICNPAIDHCRKYRTRNDSFAEKMLRV